MSSLIPWKRQRGEVAGNGGALAERRGFPNLMRRMQSEFEELFDRFARDLPILGNGFGSGWRWGLDVEDEEDRLVVKAEAPGFDPDDFDLRVEGDRLILSASKKVETKDDKGKVKEYREQACYESVALPTGVDIEKVDAKYRNGMLTVTIPKTKEGRPKKIAVKNA